MIQRAIDKDLILKRYFGSEKSAREWRLSFPEIGVLYIQGGYQVLDGVVAAGLAVELSFRDMPGGAEPESLSQ